MFTLIFYFEDYRKYYRNLRRQIKLEKRKQQQRCFLFDPLPLAKQKKAREKRIDESTMSLLKDIADLRKNCPSVVKAYERFDTDKMKLRLDIQGLIANNLLTDYRIKTVICYNNPTIKSQRKKDKLPLFETKTVSKEPKGLIVNPCVSDYTGLSNQPGVHKTRNKFTVRCNSRAVGITSCQWYGINRYRVIDKLFFEKNGIKTVRERVSKGG
jgi:hypothetical protein